MKYIAIDYGDKRTDFKSLNDLIDSSDLDSHGKLEQLEDQLETCVEILESLIELLIKTETISKRQATNMILEHLDITTRIKAV